MIIFQRVVQVPRARLSASLAWSGSLRSLCCTIELLGSSETLREHVPPDVNVARGQNWKYPPAQREGPKIGSNEQAAATPISLWACLCFGLLGCFPSSMRISCPLVVGVDICAFLLDVRVASSTSQKWAAADCADEAHCVPAVDHA